MKEINENRIIEFGLLVIAIFFINLQYNPHTITMWKETWLPLILIVYPIYILWYYLMRYMLLDIWQRIKENIGGN